MNNTTETALTETPAQEVFFQEEIKEIGENSPYPDEALLHTDPKKAQMVKALIKSLGIVAYAAQEAGICRKTHYNWMETDAEYKAAVKSINEVSLDYAEARLF